MFGSITIPDGITEIGYKAFYECKSLKSVTISDSIMEIKQWAFQDDTNLEKVVTTSFEIKIHDNSEINKQIRFVAFVDFSMKIHVEAKYDIVWQMFIQKSDDKDVFAYIKKNFMKMFRFAIDNNDVETIFAVCKRKDLLTKKNIDSLIEYAIRHTQKGGTVEIQALLMCYKNENIGYSEREIQYIINKGELS